MRATRALVVEHLARTSYLRAGRAGLSGLTAMVRRLADSIDRIFEIGSADLNDFRQEQYPS